MSNNIKTLYVSLPVIERKGKMFKWVIKSRKNAMALIAFTSCLFQVFLCLANC